MLPRRQYYNYSENYFLIVILSLRATALAFADTARGESARTTGNSASAFGDAFRSTLCISSTKPCARASSASIHVSASIIARRSAFGWPVLSA